MAKKEVKTDLWIARQLDDSKIKYDAQGSDVKEINDALQSASKRGTGNAGYPEYVAVVKDGAGIGRVMCLPEKSSVIGTMQYLLRIKLILPSTRS